MTTAYYEKALTEDLNVGTSTAVKRNPNGGTITGTQIGVHTFAVTGKAVTSTWNPASVASGSKVSTTVTVTGAALGDFVLRSFSLDVQELSFTADVSATNTVEVVLANLTGSAVDLGSGTLKVAVLKSA
jgi:hypothetical protein